MKKVIGICLGASSASLVQMVSDGTSPRIIASKTLSHNGTPIETAISLLKEFDAIGQAVVFTGRKFRNLVSTANITEPEATELAYDFLYPNGNDFEAIASLGGETFMVYTLDKNGKISDVITKNQCAAGTGEFFLQQISRMDLDINQSIDIARSAEPFRVSGRCSVFCKSDCTHALNKGTPKSEVTAGLALMISDKIEELLNKRNLSKILLLGGVTRNEIVMNFTKKRFPDASVIPDSPHFEALGAALFALNNNIEAIESIDGIFAEKTGSFAFHKPLRDFENQVVFSASKSRKAVENENCILGLDVGSTTTKAVIISQETDEILAKVYLYTHGNPIKAARDCYSELSRQIGETKINIVGIGTTGSGRHIAAIHCGTDGVYNEITAHSTAAVQFDPNVDTIFEIGGQDAKYTYIVNQVPADYAMNEACSAGTGSFIEESAWESLGIKVTEVQDYAMNGTHPPNFSDQCSAFISSDIKTAQQENINKNDILAGLVYSVCLNYVNRVKGNRQVGNKIFMQGGVCYNKAIPIAMAALTGKQIIVPPDPGLMGAFGVALEVKQKQGLALLPIGNYDLKLLAEREISYREPFVCMGGAEKCDLKCSINVFEIDGKKFPFGGACDKYYSYNKASKHSAEKYDFVAKRNHIVYNKFAKSYDISPGAVKVGMNNSFHLHTLYPFFYNFFSKLGFQFIVPQKVDERGYDREISSLCFPSQLSLGLFQELINLKPDYIFMPSVLEMESGESCEQRLDFNCTCVFVSGEPFYVKQAFKGCDEKFTLLSPNLNFANGIDREEKTFIEIAEKMGIHDKGIIREAFRNAVEMQRACQLELHSLGSEVMQFLSDNPQEYGMVLIGRPYNSFSDLANKGIPQKYASRGVYILPFDIFDNIDETIDDDMYWESGKKILRAAKFVKKHKNLFATYISNYSCAPDSMILNTFRSIMGAKPSLTLELDSHSADAGINTRIEAAIDIISNFRRLDQAKAIDNDFNVADIQFADPMAFFIKSDGERIPLNDPSVEILIPSMGDLASELFAAALRSLGFNAKALPEPNAEVLKIGRANSSGKECLPLLLMVGELLNYIENESDGSKNIAFFTVQGAGNCRLGQYPVFIRELLRRRKIPNVAQMVLMNEDGFAGLGENFALRGIQAILASDVLDDVRNGILANSIDPKAGMLVFNEQFELLKQNVESQAEGIYKHLEHFAENIKQNVAERIPIEQSKYVAMLGEIFVRRDGFAHKWLNRQVAEKGFIMKTAYISEWIFYVDYLLQIDLLESEKSLKKKLERQIRNFFMRDAERRIKKTLEKSGYYKFHRTEIEPLLKHSKHLLPYQFKGEPGLTLGIALHEGLEKYAGIINLGPFGCMPTRLSESIAMPEMNIEGKLAAKRIYQPDFKMSEVFNGSTNIPFLTIETDGNVYPQIINAKIETFIMQAERSAELMKQAKANGHKDGQKNWIGRLFSGN